MSNYIVIEIEDTNKFFTPEEQATFTALKQKINEGRVSEGREIVSGVFIDASWNIYPEVMGIITTQSRLAILEDLFKRMLPEEQKQPTN